MENRSRPMRMVSATALLLASLIAAVVPAAPASAAILGPCPEMTDSVYRLYTAYFLRNPEQGGFEFWVDQYSSGARNIRQISEFFAQSDEFIARYGSLTNEEFVELVYENVLDRDPDTGGLAFWTGRLDDGYPRGALMIGFSESEEYVVSTGTVRSLAGYGRIYPVGTTWHCGKGVADFAVNGPVGNSRFDALGINANEVNATITMRAVRSNGSRLTFYDQRVGPDAYVLSWPIAANPPTAFGTVTRVEIATDQPESHWTVVFYPDAIAADKPGWDDPTDTPGCLRGVDCVVEVIS